MKVLLVKPNGTKIKFNLNAMQKMAKSRALINAQSDAAKKTNWKSISETHNYISKQEDNDIMRLSKKYSK